MGLIAALTISISVVWAQSKENSVAEWTWTKENPKPGWWKWDETYYPTKPVRGGYFRTAVDRYVGLMNPNHWPVNDFAVLSSIYDRLIYPDGNYRPVIPGLATSWKYENPLTITMTLRKGVKFHDGSPFNAESVKYQMDWLQNPENGAWSRAWIKPLESVEIVDEYTVRWHLKHPWSSFFDVIANVPGWMMSTKALKEDPDSLDEWAIGTGPWMVEEARPGNYLKLKRNPDWWFAKSIGMPEMPYFDGAISMVIPEKSVQLANLKAGKIDTMYIDPPQYAQIKDDPNLDVWITNLNFTIAMKFNHAKGPCKDILVRKAISHAIDRKALVAAAAFGFGRIASCLFPDDHWAHNPNLKPVEYNPELSKKLLADAGYAKGLTITGQTYSDNQAVRFGQAIKAMLKRVNINWEVETLDPVSLADKDRNLEYDANIFIATYIKDPDSATATWYDPDAMGNMGRSNNKEAVQLMEAARGELDFEKRKQIYHDLEKALYDQYEDAWLWHYIGITATRKQVLGYNREMQIEGGEAYWPTHPLWFKDGKQD